MDANAQAVELLQSLPPRAQLEAARRRLCGEVLGPLGALTVGSELEPRAERIDGRLLEAVAGRGLSGERGVVFTAPPEARLLAALGLARAAARRGEPEAGALEALLRGCGGPALRAALDGLRVLDPCCGGGALLVAALALARGCGAELALHGLEVTALASEACRARLQLLGAEAEVACADALAADWPEADLILVNPPFLRHEAMSPGEKARAVARSGLGRQADLSAHLALLCLRHAPDVALVWPRGLDGARSAAPLRAEAEARGGFVHRLRSAASGSFAASVETALAVWSAGAAGRPALEAALPLGELSTGTLVAMARGEAVPGVRARSRRVPSRGATRLGEACAVRFGVKTGCNAFFHLLPLGGERFTSSLAGEVELPPAALQPLLASLKEAPAPALATPRRLLLRPPAAARDLFQPGPPDGDEVARDPRLRSYLELGEDLGVAERPTCRGRSPWWLVTPGRSPAPVLYPAKVGARAFAFVNERGLWEDKKWHALFPAAGLPPWLLAAVLTATPVRLAIEEGARQLTGAQAIADIDCHVLAAAPFPSRPALAALEVQLAACWAALAVDPVTTDLRATLARPAQEELDLRVGEVLGLSPPEVREARRALACHVEARLGRAEQVRAAVAAAGRR